MNYGRILANFLEENKGKRVKFFIINGFQLHGQLVDYDETHAFLQTDAYGRCKKVPVTISSITTFVPD